MRTPNQAPPAGARGRLAAAVVMAAVLLAGPLAAAAFAEGPGPIHENERGSWQERGRRNEHWRPENRFNGYYSAPPVVYAAPGYYQQPSVGLNFSFPLSR
jgi:hypothetical protein